MKGGKSLAELQEKYTINGHCIVCGKGFQYPYGRHHVDGQLQSGTCSLACERIKEPRDVDAQTCGGSPRSEDWAGNQGDTPDGLLQEVRETNA